MGRAYERDLVLEMLNQGPEPEEIDEPGEEAEMSTIRERCDWPAGEFSFADDPGEHAPCYVIMPGGAMISLNHHAVTGVDIARAKFIIDACNEKLAREV